MVGGRESLRPVAGAARPLRQRLDLKDELLLALLPTLTVLIMLGMVAGLSQQRVLFAALASSAFLIYLDPLHAMNSMRTLIIAQPLAAAIGLLISLVAGHGYWAAGGAMVATILAMILLDAVHPPAIGTALSFAFRPETEGQIPLFVLALGITVALIGVERGSLWLLARLTK